jgi:hypothetical protein
LKLDVVKNFKYEKNEKNIVAFVIANNNYPIIFPFSFVGCPIRPLHNTIALTLVAQPFPIIGGSSGECEYISFLYLV